MRFAPDGMTFPRTYCGTGAKTSASLSIPLDKLEARLAELPATQEIVAYCRGPYCLFADEAVALLTAHGYRVRRLAEGYPEWQAAGLAVETTLAVHEE